MVAFQCKDRQNLLRGWFFAAMFAAAHFYYLDNIEAAVLVAIIGIRFLVSSITFDKRLMYFFMAISIAAYAYTYAQPVSLLALSSVWPRLRIAALYRQSCLYFSSIIF
jgi:hypothetical protein